jgi:hypothetical protein
MVLASCRVVRWRRLSEDAGPGRADAVRAALAAEDTCANAGLLLLLRAADRFHAAHSRFPGAYDRRAPWARRRPYTSLCGQRGAARGFLGAPRCLPCSCSRSRERQLLCAACGGRVRLGH